MDGRTETDRSEKPRGNKLSAISGHFSPSLIVWIAAGNDLLDIYTSSDVQFQFHCQSAINMDFLNAVRAFCLEA